MKTNETAFVAVRSLALFSTAKIFAFYYSLWGLVTGLVFAFTHLEKWELPLGFLVPFLSAKLDWRFMRSETLPGLVVQVLLITLTYTLTGWLSGLLGGAIYNLISKHFGLQVLGRMETLISEPRPSKG